MQVSVIYIYFYKINHVTSLLHSVANHSGVEESANHMAVGESASHLVVRENENHLPVVKKVQIISVEEKSMSVLADCVNEFFHHEGICDSSVKLIRLFC